MSAVTPAQIKELRDRTSAGMSDCKNALVEAAGDMEKAVEIILKKGIVKAAARAGKVATEGEVATWTSPDGKKGVIVDMVVGGPMTDDFLDSEWSKISQ